EEVHQHGLAASDLAVEVKSPHRLGLVVAEQPADRSRAPRQPMRRKPRLEVGQLDDDRFLRRVALDLSGGNEGRVTGANGTCHGWWIGVCEEPLPRGIAAAAPRGQGTTIRVGRPTT